MIDDYDLIDQNFDEFIRRGLEGMEWECRDQFGDEGERRG